MKKFMLSILLLLTISGCSDSKANQTAVDENQLVFTNYGRTITINEVPDKVLTMGPNTTELFCQLGLADKIIGNTLNNHSRGPLPEYKEDYEKIPELTHGSATREAVLSSGADFIYGIDWEFGSEGLSLDELEENDITVYQNSAKTIDEVYQEITDIGTIFDVEDKAATFIQQQKDRLHAVANTTAKEPAKVLVYDSGDSGIFTASGSNYESRLIEAAGGVNLFEDQTEKDWITVSSEEVLERQPDIILVHDYDQPTLNEKIAAIKSDPALSQLDAVKNNRIISMSLENALPGPRLAETVETLAAGFQKK
ncbi:ABC transporter substrate-binding protein [Candidatus Enterococcus ferrettii]|uniref:Iron complex transport system substrate-binding protein n=1 Tax=Candidatus Enterococcus ferrettii TaxID=2815324 RepID=A0ABV0ETP2_9ENTE|nr:ABC transporter substrate-binding protein [Enterococcus sp. 665A]MBO1342251.1 ABC transporter substrate-binding protein [Enterococcus sp. 665A]